MVMAMAGKSSSLVMIMCLLIVGLSVSVNGVCRCCVSQTAKDCCAGCMAIATEWTCMHTCCFPCAVSDGETSAEEFCKLGCTSSKCSDIVVEIGNQEQQSVMERCHNACHNFCTKDANLAIIDA